MLPGKLIEESCGGFGAPRLHVLDPLADGFKSFLVVLAFPFKVVRQGVVKGISGTLPTSARELLQLSQSFGFYRKGLHDLLKVEVRRVNVNSQKRSFRLSAFSSLQPPRTES